MIDLEADLRKAIEHLVAGEYEDAASLLTRYSRARARDISQPRIDVPGDVLAGILSLVILYRDLMVTRYGWTRFDPEEIERLAKMFHLRDP